MSYSLTLLGLSLLSILISIILAFAFFKFISSSFVLPICCMIVLICMIPFSIFYFLGVFPILTLFLGGIVVLFLIFLFLLLAFGTVIALGI